MYTRKRGNSTRSNPTHLHDPRTSTSYWEVAVSGMGYSLLPGLSTILRPGNLESASLGWGVWMYRMG